MWLSASGKPAGTPSMTATRASPWDSPAVRNRNIPLMATTLLYFFGAGGGGGGCAASTFRTDGVMNTTSSRPVVCEAVVLNSHPRTGMSPNSGSFRTSSASRFVVTPPMTRRSPSLMRTSVCALRLLSTGGADRRVGNFFVEGDRGGPVLDGDDLGARERPRLAEQAQRLEREVDV